MFQSSDFDVMLHKQMNFFVSRAAYIVFASLQIGISNSESGMKREETCAARTTVCLLLVNEADTVPTLEASPVIVSILYPVQELQRI